MRVLVLLPESPFPWASTASRYYGALLKGLDEVGHDVIALSVRGQARGPGEPSGYFDDTRIRFRSYHPPSPRPWLEQKLRSAWRADWELAAARFGAHAREVAEEADVVLAEHPSTARAVEGLPHAVCSLHCLRHIDLSADPATASWRTAMVRRAERTTLARTGRVRVLTRRLAGLAAAIAPSSRYAVVPLCIDPGLYSRLVPPVEATVGFVGSMFWEPSRAAALRFIQRIVPRVRRAHASARFIVAGWDAERYLSTPAAHAGVELVDGFLHPRDVFGRLTMLVNAPPLGTGMKVKVLEAMAFGVPVVSNAEGAEGLDWDPEAPLVRAETDDDIAARVVELLDNPARREQLAADGRQCVERSFSPAVVAPRLMTELAALIAGPEPARLPKERLSW